MFRDLWWGKKEKMSKLYLKILRFNLLALIIDRKASWKVLLNKDKSWIKILKAKYFRGSSFMRAKSPKSTSWHWTSFLSDRDILRI